MSVELFNWKERWESDVVPLLDHPKVKASITWFKKERGKIRAPFFKGMKPFLPYQCGRKPNKGWKVYATTDMEAYCPNGECHWIAAFASAVGQVLYPNLTWRMVGEELHTIAVGFREGAEGTPQYRKTCGRIEVVSDILMSYFVKTWTAENAIAYSVFWRYRRDLQNIDLDRVLGSPYHNEMVEVLAEQFLLTKEDCTPSVMEGINQGEICLD
jgi:hypothetical protein